MRRMRRQILASIGREQSCDFEQRLSLEVRASICAGRNTISPNGSNRDGFYLRLKSIYDFIPKALNFTRQERSNPAVKQSVKD